MLHRTTEHQPRAQLASSAALGRARRTRTSFADPEDPASGRPPRAFAAEILAAASADAEDARRRALLDPSPHPDLVWLAPNGAQHIVEEVRERVIRAAAYRPFEGGKRVFVIEAAEAMRDESQNALLKTLEEPPEFAHLILLCAEPAGLLETIASRCQPVDFAPLPVEARVRGGRSAGTGEIPRDAGGRKALSRRPRARPLPADRCGAGAAREGGACARPPRRVEALLLEGDAESAEAAGEESEAAAREALEEQRAVGIKRSAREASEEAKRAGRRRRTEVLDLGLALAAAWLRDLTATAVGAADLVFNRDRAAQLRSQVDGLDPADARRAVELVQDSRRRLDLNVSEELALEALFFRLERLTG